MRRFIAGLLVGLVVGWVVAWRRMRRPGRASLMELDQQPTRISLPDLPWGDEAAEDVPTAEPAVAEVPAQTPEATDDALGRAQDAVQGEKPMLAYCARCRAKRPIKDAAPTVAKDGRPAVRGACPECDANMFRFVSF